MDPHVQNITLRTFSTKEIFVRIRTSVWNDTLDIWEPGPYKDLTGFTFLAQIRVTADDTLVTSFTCTPGDQGDPIDGIGSLLLKITDEVTATLTPGMAGLVWDLKVTEPDGDAFPYMEGTVTIKKGVSHA